MTHEGAILRDRRTDCRVIEMRASASFRDSRRVKAPASRVPGFAICAVRCDGLRSWPPAATITVLSNLRGSQHLRPKARSIVAGSIRQNEGKALLRLEIRWMRKKLRRFRSLPAAFALRSWGKRPGIGGADRRHAGNNTNQNRHSSAVAPLALGRSCAADEASAESEGGSCV